MADANRAKYLHQLEWKSRSSSLDEFKADYAANRHDPEAIDAMKRGLNNHSYPADSGDYGTSPTPRYHEHRHKQSILEAHYAIVNAPKIAQWLEDELAGKHSKLPAPRPPAQRKYRF